MQKMKTSYATFLVLVLAVVSQGWSQKYLDRDQPTVKQEYKGQQLLSTRTLSENLEAIPSLTTYAGYMADYQSQSMDDNFTGTFFVITNKGMELKDDTEALQLLASRSGQKDLIEALVVPGRLDANELVKAAKKRGGTLALRNLSGGTITLQLEGDSLFVTDKEERKARIIASDFLHKNGFFHILDAFVYPQQ
jgi:hypothetical protein